jgi:hypothetical protein
VVNKLWGACSPGGAVGPLTGGGVGGVCMRDIVLILNEIWAQDKVYILVDTLLG